MKTGAMRLLPCILALFTLTGCVSAEQRMIAIAKTKCAEEIAKAPWQGTLAWTARQHSNGNWQVDGWLEPQRYQGVILLLSPDGSGLPVPGESELPCAPMRLVNPLRR